MAVRYGRQSPTFEVVGKYASTRGEKAVSLFEFYGSSFMPSQKYEINLFLARDKGGRAAAKTIGISKPRQNGKSYGARHYAIWAAAVEGKKVLYTAHHGNTTREMFKLLRNFVEGIEDFSSALGRDGVRRATGAEGIYFANGGLIEFNTRTNSVARGKTYDVIIVDEAQELTDEQADALTPTTLASGSGDPQMIYLGTPPNEKCPGTVFRQLHDRAHAGTGGGTWWLEWAATEIGDPHDVDRWYECCPGMGYLIKEDVMADSADKSSLDGFAREYLGWWNKRIGSNAAIDEDDWDACKTDDPPKEGILSCAVKFSPDGKLGVLAVCRKPKDAPPHVEIVSARSTSHGVKYFADWIEQRQDKLAQATVDGLAKADALMQKLTDRGVSKRIAKKAKTADVVAACSMFEDAVSEGQLTHFGQPGLDDSATKCTRRKIGNAGGWGFAESEGAEPAIIEAAALAYWTAMTTKRNPNRKMRVG